MTDPHPPVAAEVIALLRHRAWAVTSEDELQQAVAQVLTEAGVAFEREHVLSSRDRVDFLIGGVALELKVGGSAQDATRQLARYAQDAAVRELVLFTTCATVARQPESLGGKPIHVVRVWGGRT